MPTAVDEAAAPQQPDARRTVAVLVAVNAVRFAFAPFFDLVPQEAYYFLYSQHLALSYFDHPPVLAWILRLFTDVFGAHELSVRLSAFATSCLTQWLWVDLARRYLGPRWTHAALIWLTSGAVTVTSLISTPDVPLLLFWTLSVHQLYAALFAGKRWAWIWAGVAMGLAFDSKYTGIMLQGGLVLFLVLSPLHRRLLRTPWPWTTLALAQLVMAPVYIWNAQHRFASFLFQTAERAQTASGFGVQWLAGLLGSQAALVGIPLLIALFVVTLRSVRTWRAAATEEGNRRLFLVCFFLPTFALFFGISLFALVKPNWLLPAYMTGTLLAAEWMTPRWRKVQLLLAAVLHVLAAVELVFYPVRIQSDDTWVGWRRLAAEVQQRAAEHPGAFIASADGYKTAAELRFYTALEVYGPNVIGQRGLQFDYTDPDLSRLVGRSALFIDSAPRDFSSEPGPGVPAPVAERFGECAEVQPILIEEGGRIVRKFRVYSCQSYRGP
ncbi:MAG: glycosyltransferase family 39 protein [Myxococcaceae bacterium]